MTLQQSVRLTDYLEASAARYPLRHAVVDPDGRVLSYKELDGQADQLAKFLRAHGVMPGDRVGVLLPKSSITVTAIFGILKAGAAFVPADCNAPAARIRSIFSDCDVRALITNSDGWRCLGGNAGDAFLELAVVIDGNSSASTNPPVVNWNDVLRSETLAPQIAVTPDENIAYILYTSGSTGIPKGVTVSHENATTFVDWCSSVFAPTEEDRFSSHAPFHFDLSVLDIYLAVKHGASLHLISEELGKNPGELARFIADRQLTVWYSTPSILALLAQFGKLADLNCRSLRLVLFAGEVFPVRHLRTLTECWPHPRYFNLYGPTETNVCTFAEVPSRIPEERTQPYPIGPCCEHCDAMVLNSDQQPVQQGQEGLLYIAGPSVFEGYWNRPKENADAFLVMSGTRWYCTGDIVVENSQEGFIYVSRRDRMVKRRGYRIELDDIECALYRHERIREVGVVSSATGTESPKIRAYLVAGSEPNPGVIELKMFCARHLPSYMNPDSFVFMKSLPRTSTNKVDYQALMREFDSGTQR